MFRILFLFCLFIFTVELDAKPSRPPRTVPMPPKQKYDPMARITMADAVPTPLENYKYTLVGEVDGKVYYSSAVPLYREEEGANISAKTLPVGTEIAPTHIKNYLGRHFYGITEDADKNKNGPSHVLWIDGRFIKMTKK